MEIKTFIDTKLLQPIRQEKPNWSDTGKEFPVYRIKLSDLHYNEENGRIATWISTYTSDSDKPRLSTLSREEYNNVIESFIKRANTTDSLKNLMNDVKKKTQLNPGVILDDGTIVSGNRRFTALRNLYREDYDEKFEYFECFIIPTPKTKDQTEFIKLIETKTQFGIVTEEDYNPIDRLVTIYRYLISEETRIWSTKEYAKKIGIKESEAENLYDRAWIMADYLEFIEKPLAFHIARERKLDGPINDLAPLFKKLKNNQMPEWNRIKPIFYSEMNRDHGDRTRAVRNVKNVYLKNSSEFEKLLSNLYKKQEEAEENTPIADTHISVSLEDKDEKKLVSLEQVEIARAVNATQKIAAKEKQIKKVSNALDTLNDVETDEFIHMDPSEKSKISRTLSKIKEKVESLQRKLGN